MSEAAMFRKMDEGSDATLQKMSLATMPPMRCAPAKKSGGSFVRDVLFDCLMPRKERPSPGMPQIKIQNFEISNFKNSNFKKTWKF
jgi:hypothetical protein